MKDTNEITIPQEKKLYTEEEVKILCEKAWLEGYDEHTLEDIGKNEDIVTFENWWKQQNK